MTLVVEWAAAHREELSIDWQLCERSEPPLPIEPLE
jgi:hypothetical protein